MAIKQALGMIETYGLTPAIEAADAMVKAASVELWGYKSIGAGLITVMIRGDVGAVKAAVDTGVYVAEQFGKINSTHVIPAPHDELQQTLDSMM